ncbi:MAG: VWA domain-containing protein [Clostridia bacterium]|nr:VWA domain-containing protein [Clostridia bacterium]
MRNNFFIKISAIALSLVTILGTLLTAFPATVNADTTEENYASKLINVVYDDSNSMLLDQRLWWCYAKYSMEVFSAMMQDKDTMNIYFMSDKDKSPRISNLSGDKSQQQQNIEKIHNTVTNTAGTPFSSLKKAYTDLKKAGGYDEKWFVVITDGDSFNDKETSEDIDALINDCAGYNIKVVYLAIGDALVPTEDINKGIYVYKADGNKSSGETGILTKVTQICQRIFQRPAMNSTIGNKLVLDIPVSEIIIFAQGANASIGTLPGTKRTLSTVAMRSSDKNKATTNSAYKNKVNIDTLNACIATFTPQSGSYIPDGTYDISINAEEYAIYYKPALDVILEMYDSNGILVTDKYIPIGSYSLKYWLSYPKGHPKHGEVIDNNDFGTEYYLTCTTDGITRTLTSDNIDLNGGDTTIKVVAQYLNFSSSNTSLKHVVEDFTINEIGVDVDYNQKDYKLSNLETNNEGFTVKVTKNGAPIPKEEWEPYILKLSTDNPGFNVVKNTDSTFTVYPRYSAGGRSETKTGDIDFNITVSASNDHRVTDAGTCPASINIYDDISAVSLGITIADQSNSCDNKNFANQDSSRKVTIDWNGNNLTKEQYDALELYVNVDDPKYTAKIELDPYVEGEPTTATVYFELVPDENGKMPEVKTLQGTKDFTVSGKIDREGQISEGSSESTLKVNDARTLGEILLDYLPLIIALLIILFLILAYAPIFKRYLPAKSKYLAGGFPHTIRWYSNASAILTLILPFVRVRSSANLQVSPVFSIPLSVKALGSRKATCTNKRELERLGCRTTQTLNLRSSAITKSGKTLVTFRR